MSFEKEIEKKRIEEERRKNIIKWYAANCSDEVCYVGSLDLQDPYSGAHIYVPSKQHLEEIEAKESAAREQMSQIKDAEEQGSQLVIESESSSSGMSEEELRIANEIYQRLMDEAAADERAKQAEIEALMQQVEASETEPSSADYNAETGSYSGLYGKKPMSQDEEDALAAIMGQNSSYTKSIEDIIKENQ